ncbi:MAG: PD-(D/E)XK nuclease family protein, partial [Thiotrichaceae bacterium]|nr:PD-(D/E)XK nuclease family protein [Thiotrichaceae bacterium]
EESLEQLVNSSEKSSSLIIIEDGQASISARHIQQKQNEQLSISKLNHIIDDHWSLNSFSSLMRESYSIRQEQKDRSDDDAETISHKTPVNLLRFSIRKGADTGNLLHDIMEHTNFSSTIVWPIESPLRRFGGLDDAQQSELTLWLEDAHETTLPVISPESVAFKLADLAWSQTLRETEFYFPMHEMQIDSLSACLNVHRGDIERIKLPDKKQLEGMMRGFIDLIFEHGGRFYVADYKSTHLGDQFEDYAWQALKNNNEQHYYDLQYLIYSLALHRYLKTRIADYDPAVNFGGVYYLYLRGMSAENKQPYGVF